MFSNNNKDTIRRVTTRSIYTNKTRNLFAVLAIMLTTFMIFTVFSIGLSFAGNYKTMQTRLGDSDRIYLQGATQEQYEQISEHESVASAGVQIIAGFETVKTELKEAASVYLTFYSEKEWNSHYLPAISDVEGSYPVTEDEVMVPLALLQAMGITEPELDMSVTFEQTYRLSGWFREYTSTSESYPVFVSEAYCKKAGSTLEENGVVVITAAQTNKETADSLKKTVELQEDQQFQYGAGSMPVSSASYLLIGMIVTFIVFSGYLLIYNVMYISVTKDIRFYGMLKTIGTSPKQIKKIVRGQAFRFGLIGIPAGILLGLAASFGLVPLALAALMAEGGQYQAMPTDVSFHPFIFIGAILFAMLAVFISCRKPAQIAAKVSPMEALKYTGIEKTSKKEERTTVNGAKPGKMAFYNVFRDKKRAFVVFLSLFMGVITFLCVSGVLNSMGLENYLDRYVADDFRLINEKNGEYDQQIQAAMSAVLELDGIQEADVIRSEQVTIPFDEAVLSPVLDLDLAWYKDNTGEEDITIEEFVDIYIKEHDNRFPSCLYEIDKAYVETYNQTSEHTIDIEAFERGEICIIGYRDYFQEGMDSMTGNLIEIRGESQGKTRIAEIGGTFSHDAVNLSADNPENYSLEGIFVSKAFMESITDQPAIREIRIQADQEKVQVMDQQIWDLIEPAGEFITYKARQSEGETFTSAIQIMNILGSGVSMLLILVGMLNFVNVMLTSVFTRKRELAVMESVGMTRSQIRKMLMYEGAYYALFTAALIMTFGNVILYLTSQWVPSLADYAKFEYPYITIIILFLVIFAVCLCVPVFVYRNSVKESITERLRETE